MGFYTLCQAHPQMSTEGLYGAWGLKLKELLPQLPSWAARFVMNMHSSVPKASIAGSYRDKPCQACAKTLIRFHVLSSI